MKFHLLTFQFVVIPHGHGKRDLSSLLEAGVAAVQISWKKEAVGMLMQSPQENSILCVRFSKPAYRGFVRPCMLWQFNYPLTFLVTHRSSCLCPWQNFTSVKTKDSLEFGSDRKASRPACQWPFRSFASSTSSLDLMALFSTQVYRAIALLLFCCLRTHLGWANSQF